MPSSAQQRQLLLIIPFDNISSAPATDWISESFPEVLGSRLNSGEVFVMSRQDRLSAFDHLGIPASARPSRATIYQVAQQLDADYVLMGDYRVENGTVTAHARLMDTERLRLSPELSESGALTDLVALQTALAWEVLHSLDPGAKVSKAEFISQFPPLRVDALENYVRGITAPNDQERIKRFKEAVRLEPANTPAILQLGKSYYNQHDYESAITWLGKVPPRDRRAGEAQFYLGLAALYAGRFERAEAAFRNLAARLPLTEVYNNLGVASARRGERSARDYFERSVQTDPNEPDYHFNLAVSLCRDNDLQGAARELRAMLALRSDPEARALLDALSSGAPPAHLPLERINHNYDESSFRQIALEIENMNEERLKKSDPATHAAFHVQRGQELFQQGLPGEAEKEFREAVALDPSNAEAHSRLARILESDQDPMGARNEARASLKLKPSAEAYLVLARIDLLENNSSGAAQNIEQALALDPGNATANALKRDLASGAAKPPSPQP